MQSMSRAAAAASYTEKATEACWASHSSSDRGLALPRKAKRRQLQSKRKSKSPAAVMDINCRGICVGPPLAVLRAADAYTLLDSGSFVFTLRLVPGFLTRARQCWYQHSLERAVGPGLARGPGEEWDPRNQPASMQLHGLLVSVRLLASPRRAFTLVLFCINFIVTIHIFHVPGAVLRATCAMRWRPARDCWARTAAGLLLALQCQCCCRDETCVWGTVSGYASCVM